MKLFWKLKGCLWATHHAWRMHHDGLPPGAAGPLACLGASSHTSTPQSTRKHNHSLFLSQFHTSTPRLRALSFSDFSQISISLSSLETLARQKAGRRWCSPLAARAWRLELRGYSPSGFQFLLNNSLVIGEWTVNIYFYVNVWYALDLFLIVCWTI